MLSKLLRSASSPHRESIWDVNEPLKRKLQRPDVAAKQMTVARLAGNASNSNTTRVVSWLDVFPHHSVALHSITPQPLDSLDEPLIAA
jgi:hypothetical protein